MSRLAEELAGAVDGGSHTESAVARAARATKGQAPKAAYIREQTVEEYFVQEVEKRGAMQGKHKNPGKRGEPDRWVAWPYPLCVMSFVELKAPEGVHAVAQVNFKRRMAKMGHTVHLLYTKGDVAEYVAQMDKLMDLVI